MDANDRELEAETDRLRARIAKLEATVEKLKEAREEAPSSAVPQGRRLPTAISTRPGTGCRG
jgi:hypothetical protein